MIRFSVTKNAMIDRRPLRAATALLLGASTTISACSFVPDWGNPVVWYDTVIEGIGSSGETPPKAGTEAVQKAQAQTGTSSLRSFPQLNAVPQQAPQASSSQERRRIAKGLVADRDNARYTDQVLRAGGISKPVAGLAPAPPLPQTPRMGQSVQIPKPIPAPAIKTGSASIPQPTAAPKLVQSLSTTARRTGKAYLPKLDLSSAPNAQTAAVTPPPQSSVSQSHAVSPVARPIVEPERGKQSAVPYPPLTGTVPSKVANGGESLIIQSDNSEAPAPIPSTVQSVPNVIGTAQSALAKAFAGALAQSASTVTTAPASTAFGAPSATPLSPSETSVPDIVRETYNRTLIVSSGMANMPTTAPNAAIAVASAGPATVLFSNGSSTLNSKAKAVIRDTAETYKSRRGSFRVVGHASHRTKNLSVQRHKLVNFQISLDRATAVANELIRLGVDKNAIQITAVSDSQPMFYESMPEGEAGNRRAEIFYTF
jgi:outer membrane protein OmpA-like peptidoglycan-associated protein